MDRACEMEEVLYVTAERCCSFECTYWSYIIYVSKDSNNKYVLYKNGDGPDQMFFCADVIPLLDIIVEDCIDLYKVLIDLPKEIEQSANNYVLRYGNKMKSIVVESKRLDVFEYTTKKMDKLSNEKYTVKPLLPVNSSISTFKGNFYIENAELVKSPEGSNIYVFEYTIRDKEQNRMVVTEKELVDLIGEY